MNQAATLQHQYYMDTAKDYDDSHLAGIDEHDVALHWLESLMKLYAFQSILDVGSGTGRCLRHLKEQGLPIVIKGVEPVAKLREIGVANGLSPTELVDGDALALPFEDNAFDIVCSFGILHHIKDHAKAVSEMCRVARCGVFISDSNNFGQGSTVSRLLKQSINAVGLWKLYDFAKTRGKGFHYSDGDGVFYSYSILNDAKVVKKSFQDVRFMSTAPSGPDIYRTATHVALFAKTPS